MRAHRLPLTWLAAAAVIAACVRPDPDPRYTPAWEPFDPTEVVARVRARLRDTRAAPRPGNTARFNGWTAHFDRYTLQDDDGVETPFSHAEAEVLRLFLESPKRLISRAQMQESLGGAAGESFDRAMDVRISRLRTKLREDPKNPRLIKTIYGAGYIFLGDVTWT